MLENVLFIKKKTKICKAAPTQVLPGAFVGRFGLIKLKGFNLHNRSASGKTRENVFGKCEECHR